MALISTAGKALTRRLVPALLGLGWLDIWSGLYIDADWFNDEYAKLKSCIACKVPYEIPHIDSNANATELITN